MPQPSLPDEIKELLTVPVTWEAFTGTDMHNQPSYDLPVTLNCWTESASLFAGGITASRQLGAVTVEPKLALYFNGDDPNVQSFSLDDRFTIGSIAGDGQALKPLQIDPYYGPNFDNTNPWIVQVLL